MIPQPGDLYGRYAPSRPCFEFFGTFVLILHEREPVPATDTTVVYRTESAHQARQCLHM